MRNQNGLLKCPLRLLQNRFQIRPHLIGDFIGYSVNFAASPGINPSGLMMCSALLFHFPPIIRR
jgi:hypothetical protein